MLYFAKRFIQKNNLLIFKIYSFIYLVSSGLTADERVNTEEYTLNKFETMKLNYSELEFKWLSKLMEFNVRESKDLIRDCIQRASKTNQG